VVPSRCALTSSYSVLVSWSELTNNSAASFTNINDVRSIEWVIEDGKLERQGHNYEINPFSKSMANICPIIFYSISKAVSSHCPNDLRLSPSLFAHGTHTLNHAAAHLTGFLRALRQIGSRLPAKSRGFSRSLHNRPTLQAKIRRGMYETGYLSCRSM
jgi:hypothetical protein